MKDAGFGNNPLSIEQRRYLGSKTKLLAFIDSILKKEKAAFRSFADIFAGTGVVADYFHSRADIIVNDILESNYLCYWAFFGKERIRSAFLLKKIRQYNSRDAGKIPPTYFSRNFANTYFDLPNAKRIGWIRDDIERLYRTRKITARERAYLVTALLYALDRIAHTVGHYDAYRKVPIPKKTLTLRPLAIRARSRKADIYKEDANELVTRIRADVVYIDPPYNSRQYSDSYHLLENLATWKKENVYGVAKKIDRAHLKSKYSLKSAGSAFGELIQNIDAKFILISYNDMGTSGDARSQSRISDHEIMSALKRRGKVTVYEKAFNPFTTGLSHKSDLKERVFFCRVEGIASSKPPVIRSERNTHLPEYVKSPLNYTGGKHKLLPQLTKLFPKQINTFYDMFCGGGNVGINATAKEIICIDKNPRVIELLKLIQKSNFEDLNEKILGVVATYGLSQSYLNGYGRYGSESSGGLGAYNKKGFVALRDAYNARIANDKPLLLLVLILYGFNNQIRFNLRGDFNLPVGKRDYNGSSRRNLANFNVITNRKNITFITGDFRDLVKKRFHPADFVYLDPPYALGLASYNESGGWSEKDEEDLRTTLSKLHAKGVRFALSNVIEHKGKINTPLRAWARKNAFTVHPIDHSYKNSNYQSTAKNNRTREVVITNY